MKILVIHVSSRIGDSLLVTPLIETIKHKFKNCKLSLFAHKRMHVLFQNNSDIDDIDVISVKRSKYKGWSFIKKFDLAFVVIGPEETDTSLIKYALRVSKKVVSYNSNSQKINKRLYKIATKDYSKNTHIIDYYLSLTGALKINPSGKRVRFNSSTSELFSMQKVIASSAIKDCKVVLGLKITSLSSKSYRDWPFNNFIELSYLIGKEYSDIGFVMLGGLDEFDKLEKLSNKLDFPVLNLSGASLREIGSAINFLDLYIGVDTGFTHLVSSSDVPMVVLYHPLNPKEKYGPINHPDFHPIDCLEELIINTDKENMMATIGPEQVFEKISLALTGVIK